MSPPTPIEIRDHLAGQDRRMQATLTRLVEFETPSDEPSTMLPALEFLATELEERGYRPRCRRGELVYASRRARTRHRPAQLVVGHVDTVWPVGTLASRPVSLDGTVLRGPGAYDMKAGLVQILFAVGAIQALGADPATEPVLLINGDEEIGSHRSRDVIERLSRVACRAFVLEPGLGPLGLLKTARKGIGRFTVVVHGLAAHAGLDPDRGASAILELSNVIQRLFALNDASRGITVNVGTIEGGIRPNVVAPMSKAVVDVRVLHHDDAARLTEAIRSLEPSTPGTTLSVEGGFGRPPMERTPGNVALLRVAEKIGAELGIEIGEATAGGGSDGNTTSQHIPTLDGLGAIGDGAHAATERVDVASLVDRTALLASLLLHPDGGPP